MEIEVHILFESVGFKSTYNGIIEMLNQEQLRNIVILPYSWRATKSCFVSYKADWIKTRKNQTNEKLDEFFKLTFVDMFFEAVTSYKSFKVDKLEKYIKVIGMRLKAAYLKKMNFQF